MSGADQRQLYFFMVARFFRAAEDQAFNLSRRSVPPHIRQAGPPGLLPGRSPRCGPAAHTSPLPPVPSAARSKDGSAVPEQTAPPALTSPGGHAPPVLPLTAPLPPRRHKRGPIPLPQLYPAEIAYHHHQHVTHALVLDDVKNGLSRRTGRLAIVIHCGLGRGRTAQQIGVTMMGSIGVAPTGLINNRHGVFTVGNRSQPGNKAAFINDDFAVNRRCGDRVTVDGQPPGQIGHRTLW